MYLNVTHCDHNRSARLARCNKSHPPKFELRRRNILVDHSVSTCIHTQIYSNRPPPRWNHMPERFGAATNHQPNPIDRCVFLTTCHNVATLSPYSLVRVTQPSSMRPLFLANVSGSIVQNWWGGCGSAQPSMRRALVAESSAPVAPLVAPAGT